MDNKELGRIADGDREQWRPSPVFGDRYKVSNLGRVRAIGGRIKSLHTDKDGYPTVNLHRDGKRKARNVHRLICEAFNGPSNPLHTEVAHMDGCRANSVATNLRWVSKVENRSHRQAHGTNCRGEDHVNSKLTAEAVRIIRAVPKHTANLAALASRFEVARRTISSIRAGKGWPHVR